MSVELDALREANALLLKAIQANSDPWHWAFNEMSDEQAEALNRLFQSVTGLLEAHAEGEMPGPPVGETIQ